MTESYPTSDSTQIENLPDRVAAVMVTVHLISRELADYHVARISETELRRLWEMYVRLGAAQIPTEKQTGLFA